MSARIARPVKHKIVAALSLAVVAALPSFATADDRGERHDRGHHISRYESRRDDWRRDVSRRHTDTRIDIDIRSGSSWEHVPPPPVCAEERVWVEPVYRTVCEKVYVQPVYRTVVEKVWVEPVIERRTERVWVPERVEVRETVCHEHGRRIVRRERVVVHPGHFEYRTTDVVVRPGYFKECPRQELVCEGRWETIERQELVSPGHWETRRLAVAPAPRYEERSSARIDLRIPIRW